MPDYRLKCLSVRRDGTGVDSRNNDGVVRDPGGVTAVSADDPENLGTNRFGIVQSFNQVRADVLRDVAAADRHDENRIALRQAAGLEPLAEYRVPAFVIGTRRQLRHVINWSIGLDSNDLSKIVHGMRAVRGAAANAEKEQSSSLHAELNQGSDQGFNRSGVELANDGYRFFQMFFGVTHSFACPSNLASSSRIPSDEPIS